MFIICADYTTNFAIWQGIMTHREDVFFLFPLLFLYIIPYTLRGGFLFYIKRLLNETGYASQRYFSARSEKYPKDTPKERGFRFPLSFGNLTPQTTQEGPAGPSWISPGEETETFHVLFSPFARTKLVLLRRVTFLAPARKVTKRTGSRGTLASRPP